MGARNGGGAGLGRRGLLAGAAALVAGGLAKLAGSGRARAAHDGSDETFIHANVLNSTSDLTSIGANSPNKPVLAVTNGPTAFYQVDRDGIQGRCTSGTDSAGVRGIADGDTGRRHGVMGDTRSSTANASGVKGLARAGATNGVWGEYIGSATNAAGVLGTASDYETQNPTVGVWGRSDSTGTGAIGTFGQSTNGSGVRGLSTNGNGVFGVSTNASGVYGFSGNSYGTAGVSNSFTGVYARSGSHWGLHAESASSFAAVFSGPIFINGSYTATGAKSAAVKNKRGEHRRMYCQESPEPWFEDFGRAELKDGRAVVPLDPEFDEVVRGDDYQVFLTEYGVNQALYVADLRPHRFEVRSNNGTAASGAFGYRVVARRLDDVGRRLEKVDVPDFSKVKALPTLPDLPPGHAEKGRSDGRDARPRDGRDGRRD